MIKIIQVFRLLFESVFYTMLLLLLVAGIIYGVHTLFENGSGRQAKSYCEDTPGKVMKIKKILSIDNQTAKVEMQDGSIHEQWVKSYLRNYKGGVSIIYMNIQVGDFICVNNKSE